MLRWLTQVSAVCVLLLHVATAETKDPSLDALPLLNAEFNPAEIGGWNDLAFWGGANALSALCDYATFRQSCLVSGDAASESESDSPVLPYITRLLENRNADELLLFADGSWDDALWWCIALVEAHTVTHNSTHLTWAEDIFNYVYTQAWNTSTCGGGLYWSSRNSYKNAITNELGIDAAARLFAHTQNKTYLSTSLGIASWLLHSTMLDPATHLFNDGLSDCKNNGGTTWSYNQGVILGGLARLSNLTGDPQYLMVAVNVANATIHTLVDSNGILTELELSGRDGQLFKGIFARYLHQLIGLMPLQHPLRASFVTFLQANVANLIEKAQDVKHEYAALWQGPANSSDPCGPSSQPSDPAHCVGPTSQTSALHALNTAVSASHCL